MNFSEEEKIEKEEKIINNSEIGAYTEAILWAANNAEREKEAIFAFVTLYYGIRKVLEEKGAEEDSSEKRELLSLLEERRKELTEKLEKVNLFEESISVNYIKNYKGLIEGKGEFISEKEKIEEKEKAIYVFLAICEGVRVQFKKIEGAEKEKKNYILEEIEEVKIIKDTIEEDEEKYKELIKKEITALYGSSLDLLLRILEELREENNLLLNQLKQREDDVRMLNDILYKLNMKNEKEELEIENDKLREKLNEVYKDAKNIEKKWEGEFNKSELTKMKKELDMLKERSNISLWHKIKNSIFSIFNKLISFWKNLLSKRIVKKEDDKNLCMNEEQQDSKPMSKGKFTEFIEEELDNEIPMYGENKETIGPRSIV